MASLIKVVKDGHSARRLTWEIDPKLQKPVVSGNEYKFPKTLVKIETVNTWKPIWRLYMNI